MGRPDPLKITVGEWLPQWLARQVQLKPTTMVRYEVALRRQILPQWELVPLARIIPLGCRELGTQPHRRGPGARNSPVRPSGAVPGTHYRGPRRTIGEERRGGVPLPRVVGKPERFLTRDQVQALAEACAPNGTLIKVLAYAGLRWDELVALIHSPS